MTNITHNSEPDLPNESEIYNHYKNNQNINKSILNINEDNSNSNILNQNGVIPLNKYFVINNNLNVNKKNENLKSKENSIQESSAAPILDKNGNNNSILSEKNENKVNEINSDNNKTINVKPMEKQPSNNEPTIINIKSTKKPNKCIKILNLILFYLSSITNNVILYFLKSIIGRIINK